MIHRNQLVVAAIKLVMVLVVGSCSGITGTVTLKTAPDPPRVGRARVFISIRNASKEGVGVTSVEVWGDGVVVRDPFVLTGHGDFEGGVEFLKASEVTVKMESKWPRGKRGPSRSWQVRVEP